MSSEIKKTGKRKTEKKYLSIIFVPHSQENVRTFKFSAVKSKYSLISALILTILVVTSFCIFTVHTINENQKLKTNDDNLKKLNLEQKNRLSEKEDELKDLKDRESARNDNINKFTEKYKEMIDTYIDKSSDNKTNRSGDRNERSFVDDINELKDILGNINKATDSQDKSFSDLSVTEEKLGKYIDSLPTLWPTSGRISSHFGDRSDPFNSDQKFHAGLDIAADYGQDIVAAGDGTVTFTGWYSGYGNAVMIAHGHGIITLYGHTSKILVKEGKKVKKGDLIARVGSTGRSTGSHLHFEVRINDKPVNPLKYLDK